MKSYIGKLCERTLLLAAALLGSAALLFGCAADRQAKEAPAPAPELRAIAVTNSPTADPKTVIIPSNAFHKAFCQKDLNDWLAMSLYVMIAAEGNYVEEVSRDDLMRNALNGMISSLDPFSEFFSPKDFEILNAGTKGSFGGIGVEVTAEPKGGAVIMAPIEGTPAFKAGLMPFDELLKINGEDVSKADMMGITRLMRGDAGTMVTVTVRRAEGSSKQEMDFVMKREIIQVNSVPESRLIDKENGIAYVRLTAFDKNLAENLEKELKTLSGEGMRGIIIDLRNNGGGLLDAAWKAAELFVPKGSLVVSMSGRAVPEQKFMSRKEPLYPKEPIVILVNKATASASEILCGALKHNRKAILIGSKTYGKGSVQNVAAVGKEGYGMKLTIAYYYTPDGECIHKLGLVPDIEIKTDQEEELAMLRYRQKKHEARYKKISEGAAGSEEEEDLMQVPDAALKAAVTVLKCQLATKE